jgi:hypothetical protein
MSYGARGESGTMAFSDSSTRSGSSVDANRRVVQVVRRQE